MHALASRSGIAIGCAVVLAAAAAAVPSGVWLEMLRGPGPHDRMLLEGAVWLRCSLAALATWLFWEGRRGAFRGRTGTRERRSWGWPIFTILVVGAAVRLVGLDTSLWGDEVETLVRYVRLAPGEIVSTYHTQNQQFLYSLIAKASTATLGEAAWTLRLPAALLGVACLYALASLACSVGARAEGLWASALLAVSYHHVWFSQNARGYTGLLLAALVSTELFLRALREQRPSLWRWYGVVAALGAWFHMNMVLIVIGQFVAWVVLHARRKRAPLANALSGFALAAVLTLALHAVATPQILGPALADRSQVSEWKNPLWTLAEMSPGDGPWGLAVAGMAIALMGWGAWDWLRTMPEAVISFGVAVAAGLALNVALGHPLWPRFFFFAIGFAALALVRSIRMLAPNRMALAMGAVLAVSASTLPAAYRPKQDYAGARELVMDRAKPGERAASAGVAGFVYSNYYAPEWELVERPKDLEALEEEAEGVWFLCSLPLHLEAYHPDVYSRVRSRYRLERIFPGTLGDGEVYVYYWRSPGDAP